MAVARHVTSVHGAIIVTRLEIYRMSRLKRFNCCKLTNLFNDCAVIMTLLLSLVLGHIASNMDKSVSLLT